MAENNYREEYDALLNGAGLYDITGSFFLEMRGSESLDFLHRISTNAVKDLPAGELVNTIFTNEKGRMIDRVTVVNLKENILLIGSPAYRSKLLSWINKYIIMEDIKVVDVSSRYSAFEMMGFQSRIFLSMIFGDDVDSLQPGKILKAGIEGVDFTLIMKNDFNINKYIITGRAEDTEFLLNYMSEHKSVFDFKTVSDGAYEILRITAGIPKAPNEINDNYNPHEANLVDEISFTKGCYIGQEVIARLDTYSKVQRKLSLLVFDEIIEPQESMIIYDEEEREAGVITSMTHSLNNDQTIALGYVKKELSTEGTKLQAEGLNQKRYSAVIYNFNHRI